MREKKTEEAKQFREEVEGVQRAITEQHLTRWDEFRRTKLDLIEKLKNTKRQKKRLATIVSMVYAQKVLTEIYEKILGVKMRKYKMMALEALKNRLVEHLRDYLRRR